MEVEVISNNETFLALHQASCGLLDKCLDS